MLTSNPLAPFAASWRDLDPEGARKLAAYLWHQHGHAIVMASALETMGWANRDALKAVMTDLYGERRG